MIIVQTYRMSAICYSLAGRDASRSVNLLDLRQCQDHFASVTRPVIRLARVALEIDRLQILERCKLAIECSQVLNFVSTGLVPDVRLPSLTR